MVNNPQYYFNITYLEEHAVLRCNIPYAIKYNLRYNIPDFRVLGRSLKEITEKILDIERNLPTGKVNLSSIENEGAGKIIPKKTLSRLCNMLNKEKGEKIFKLIPTKTA